MGRSLQFRVYEHQLFALFRLAFAPAPHFLLNLAGARNSLAHSSIGTPSLALRLLVDIRFQVLFHSAPAVLFTFPSRYWFAIGLSGVFSLTGWSRQIHAEFLVLRATQDTTMLRQHSNTQLSCSMVFLSRKFFSDVFMQRRSPTTPPMP